MSVCHAKGFVAGTAACGMKASGQADLALLVSQTPATAAGVFTRNAVVAAPVVVSRRQVADGHARVVVTNSGLANACTGERGFDDAWAMVGAAAEATGVDRGEVLVASTGVIGRPLPIDQVTAGIGRAAEALGADHGQAVAQAIRTTDAFPKTAQLELSIGGTAARVGGMAKGAGMIRPDMATTLAQITTDAEVPADVLRRMLRAAMDDSFNAISVDACTSTNDCAFLLANGAGGARADSPRAVAALSAAVAEVAHDLARQVVRDGEGATRVCTFRVSGAAGDADARLAARAVAENVLVKCALHGGDPNWGRMLAALGASGAAVEPLRISVRIGGVPVVERGSGVDGSEPAARAALETDEVQIELDLGLSDGRARVIASDLSPGYVAFNAGVTS
ncbi:MAG: bifunctional glutamate N-acetyltransferase/amino-acid acetyltransferase ArgJ [Gaiellales bacterium]